MVPSAPFATEEDDDVPPPLCSLQGQLQAAQAACSGYRSQNRSSAEGEPLRVATVLVATDDAQGCKTQTTIRQKPAIKRGFFDSKPAAAKLQPACKSRTQTVCKEDAIPVLKGKKEALAPGFKTIPDFLRIEPSEQDKQQEAQYAQVRGQLLTALKPTQDTVSKVTANPELLAGFDDPELMAAVAEIGQDPRSMRRYKDNKKVLAFYAAFSKALGVDEKLQGIMAGQQGKAVSS